MAVPYIEIGDDPVELSDGLTDGETYIWQNKSNVRLEYCNHDVDPTGKATGNLRITAPEGTEIPAGSIFVTQSGIRFSTDADAEVGVGDTHVDVATTALRAGTDGNIADQVALAERGPDRVKAVTSVVAQGAFAGGLDLGWFDWYPGAFITFEIGSDDPLYCRSPGDEGGFLARGSV